MLIKLAIKSLQNRKSSILLSILAMTVSIFVLLGVEHIRHQAKESFSQSISGVDLIVGARTGSLNLLLYSVFKIGNPTNNISWQSFEKISNNNKVKWAVPISLGDSHKGYRVLGTSTSYFDYVSYGKQHSLTFEQGKPFNHIFDVVLGADVAKKLGYQLNDKLVLAHGIAKTSFALHDSTPFTVVGILKPTGTPIDHTLHVSLQGIEAMHVNWQKPRGVPKQGVLKALKNKLVVSKANHTHNMPVVDSLSSLQPKSITAIMVGLKSKISTFRLQREINHDKKEPLLAILPGVALSELWQMMTILENTLLLVSYLVLISACLGVSAMLLASIRERSREIELLRMIGASPVFLFLFVELEAILIAIISIVLGAGMLFCSLVFTKSYLAAHLGLHISANILTADSLYLIALVMIVTFIIATLPSISSSGVFKRA